MRRALWVVLTVIALHQAAMSVMPHATAAGIPMAHATIAQPQPCSTSYALQSLDPCLDSCSLLQNTMLSRSSATLPSPSTPVMHTLIGAWHTPSSATPTVLSGPAIDAGRLRPSVLLALRI